jgi:hypothetical protein
MINLTKEELDLLKRIAKEEFPYWPGAAEMPGGALISEREDHVLWSLIKKINSA